jgi:hypothetical protein
MSGTTFRVLLGACAALAGPLAAQSGEWRTDFSQHTVPLDEIVSGGPPKDGIPAIDHRGSYRQGRPRAGSRDASRWSSSP